MSLEKFFSPQSVAIVGASQQKGKVGYEMLKSMQQAGYEGDIYPVNPKADSIEGLKCYSDLKAIGKTPDLVVIIIPSKFVPSVMEQCAEIGVKSVLIITAGFKETGEEGRQLEEKVKRIAKDAGIRMIGPNCLGIIVPSSKLNASFGGGMPEPGSTAYISQSGALLAAILDMANASGIGFSKLVSIGNKADIDELDLIQALSQDDQTKVIAGYLENVTKGAEFVEHAEKISMTKPILLMKSGGTAAGAKAASSHTGSLAGGEAAYKAAFSKAGIIRCNSITQQFAYAQAFANQPLPKGKKVAVITNAGGPGIMAADAIERENLEFSRFEDATIEKLKTQLPAAANFYNPVDVLGDALADRYEFALEVVMNDPNVDVGLVLLTPQSMTDVVGTAQAVVDISKKIDKPILACFLGADMVSAGIDVFQKNQIPQYNSPERAVETIRVLADYADWRKKSHEKPAHFKADREKAAAIIEKYLQKGEREIGEVDAKEILRCYDFPTPQGRLASDAENAVKVANEIGYPVVMKISSPDVIHKSDAAGVKVGLENDQQVKEAFEQIISSVKAKVPNADIHGILVEQMKKGGREVILGVNRDPAFGSLIMFGGGGIMVEVMKDVSFALAPVNESQAKELIQATKTSKILEGVRGQGPADIDALVDAIVRLSQLVTDFPQIKEMDINPFMVLPQGKGAIAVDARISVEKD